MNGKLVSVASQWKHPIPLPETGEHSPLNGTLFQGCVVHFVEGSGVLMDINPENEMCLIDGDEGIGWWVVSIHDIALTEADVKHPTKILSPHELRVIAMNKGYSTMRRHGTRYVVIPSPEENEPAQLRPLTYEVVHLLPYMISI